MRKSHFFKIVLVSVILVTTSCKKTVLGTNEDEENQVALTEAKNEVVGAGEEFVIAINNGNAEAAANCYTTDAKIMLPNGKPIIGRTEILKIFKERKTDPGSRFSMKTIDVFGEGNYLTAEEEWIFSDKDGNIIDEGKSLEVFKKEDGKWKMFRDCFNSNRPFPSR